MIQYQNSHLTIYESQMYKTTSTVMETEDCVIVVDPCLLPGEIEEIRAHVSKVKGERPVYLIITHSDWDHIAGAGAFPEAVVIGGAALKEKSPDGMLEQVKAFDDQYYIDRNVPLIFPFPDIEISYDGQQVKTGETTITFYEAKGHTDDGIFAIVEPLGVWIAGDYFSDIEFPFIYSGSEDYVRTLEKTDAILANHAIHVLIPGHGHAAFGKEEILKRKHESLQYIRELKKALLAGKEHDHLIDPYPYPRGMKACHEENVRFLVKEMEKS